MQNNLGYPVLLALTVYAGAVCAESASDQLTRIETETLLLKAREKQLDVQAGILARQNEIVAKQVLNEQLAQSAVAGDPVIRAIEGIGNKFFATLQVGSGNTVDVQTGDVLANGMKIVSIRPNEVIAETPNKRRVRLATASQAAVTFNPSYPNTGLRLPPPPPVAMPGGATK